MPTSAVSSGGEPDEREAEERRIARQHQELAVGEIEHAGDAVLQIEADGDQRIDAADHQAPEQEIEEIEQHTYALRLP